MGRKHLARVFLALSFSLFVAACGSRSSNNDTLASGDGTGDDDISSGFTPAPVDGGTFGGGGSGTGTTLDFGDGKKTDVGATADGTASTTTPSKTLTGEGLDSLLAPFQDKGLDTLNLPASIINQLPLLLGGIDNIRPLNWQGLPDDIQRFITCYIVSKSGTRVSEFTLAFAMGTSMGVNLTPDQQLQLVQRMGVSTNESGRNQAALQLLRFDSVVNRFIDRTYVAALGRFPTDAERNRQRSIYLSSGDRPWENVIADVTGWTNEFARRAIGGRTLLSVSFDTRFRRYIDLMYRIFAFRGATVGEMNQDVNAVRNAINNRTVQGGSYARVWLSKRLLERVQFERAFVEITSQQLLGQRDLNLINSWTARMQSNELDRLRLVAVVLASFPYYNRIQQQFGFIQEFSNTCGGGNPF